MTISCTDFIVSLFRLLYIYIIITLIFRYNHHFISLVFLLKCTVGVTISAAIEPAYAAQPATVTYDYF